MTGRVDKRTGGRAKKWAGQRTGRFEPSSVHESIRGCGVRQSERCDRVSALSWKSLMSATLTPAESGPHSDSHSHRVENSSTEARIHTLMHSITGNEWASEQVGGHGISGCEHSNVNDNQCTRGCGARQSERCDRANTIILNVMTSAGVPHSHKLAHSRPHTNSQTKRAHPLKHALAH